MVDTSDDRCAVVCAMVSYHGVRPPAQNWQQQVNDLIRALRDERNSSTRREAKLRDALGECISTLELSENIPAVDPIYGTRVEELGHEIGFGALMSSASASWHAGMGGLGGQFTVGACHMTVVETLRRARSAFDATKPAKPDPSVAEAGPTIANVEATGGVLVLLETAGAVRYGPADVLQQQFATITMGEDGRQRAPQIEWRDVPKMDPSR